MVAAADAASQAPNAAAGRPHPTYSKMITHALTELGGASARPGIAEYILDRFSGLPAKHDHLLSAHLRRLVSEGVLRTHGPDSSSYIFDPPTSEDTPVPVPVGTGGEKRGRGRPRKNPYKDAALSVHTCGIAAPPVLPAKRKLSGEDGPSVTKRGPGRPATHQSAHIQAGAQSTEPIQEAVEGEEARTFQDGGDSMPVQSGGASKRGRGRPRKEKPQEAAGRSSESGNAVSMVVKRGRGRPRKEKPRHGRPRKEKPAQEAQSPTAESVATASRGFTRGCGRPGMGRPSGVAASLGIKTGGGTPGKDKPAAAAAISAETSMEKLAAAAAAIYAETGGDTAAAPAAIQAGGGQSRIEKLAEAVVAMSAKKGRGRPTQEKPAAPAGVKRSRGRPRKAQCVTGLVEAAVEELFRDMMTRREEEDLVSGDKMQTEEGVAPGDRNETRAATMPAEGGDPASARIEAGGGTPRMEESSAARSPETVDAASTGVKRKRGRPRKEKSAAIAMPADTGDAASTVVKRGRGWSRMEVSRSPDTGDAVSAGIMRPRGRPRKNPVAATSAETGDVVSTAVKRGRRRLRKEKRTPPAEGKRSRGRPRKDQPSAGEVLFRDVAEASTKQAEVLVSAEKTQAEGIVAPGDMKN